MLPGGVTPGVAIPQEVNTVDDPAMFSLEEAALIVKATGVGGSDA